MEKIGIICEYNPFHNGHIYHINKIKEKYPDSLIILILNGYFLERGNISIVSKEDKTKIALDNSIDIVIELPVLFGCQSADTFAYTSVKLLNYLNVNKIIFGSEANDIDKLYEIAKLSLDKNTSDDVKELLDQGINYPTALAKSLKTDFDFNPNDLLAISYIKATLQINDKIKCECIKRTNSYLDTTSDDSIVSADNIREKLNNNIDITKYVPKNVVNYINKIDNNLYFNLLKTSILNNNHLNEILDVDEGIENRLYKGIYLYNDLDSFIKYIKSKRYTYNRINRMFIHILLGIKKSYAKEDVYLRILGFNQKGKEYLNSLKNLPEFNKEDISYQYEKKASLLYDILTGSNTKDFENKNKPIIK